MVSQLKALLSERGSRSLMDALKKKNVELYNLCPDE